MTPSKAPKLHFEEVKGEAGSPGALTSSLTRFREHDVEATGVRTPKYGKGSPIPVSRTWLLARVTSAGAIFGPALADTLRGFICGLPADHLAEILVAGMLRTEAPEGARGLLGTKRWDPGEINPAAAAQPGSSPGTPHPGLRIGAPQNPMARAARQRESLHMEAVYRFHPCLCRP